MPSRVAYDDLAEIYDAWAAHYSDPAMEQNRAFYAREYVAAEGPVVELGVGNGRILIEAARSGKAVIGVDSSARMLEMTREGSGSTSSVGVGGGGRRSRCCRTCSRMALAESRSSQRSRVPSVRLGKSGSSGILATKSQTA